MVHSRNSHIPVENTSHLRFIPTVLDRIKCEKHFVPKGVPCFHLPRIRGYAPAVCNERATLAGMTGRISPTSFMVRSTKKH